MSTYALDRLISSGAYQLDRLVDVTGTPTITAIGSVTDAAAFTITGTGLSGSGNSVFIQQGTNTISVPINTESTTSITTNALDTSMLYITQPIAVYVNNASGVSSNAVTVSVQPATGQSATAITQTFLGDPSTRGSSVPDLGFTDEVRIKNVVGGTISNVTMTGQGAFVVASGVTAFDYGVQDGTTLGNFATATWADPPATATVPNILSMTLAQAIAAIQAVGLVATQIASQQSATIAANLVAAQFPVSGTALVLGGTVEITLSLGATGTIVPILIGLPQAQADLLRTQARLTGMDFRIIDGNNSGVVLNQSVNPGTVVNVGDSVDIAYSTNLCPNVLGYISQDGEAILLAAGLLVGENPPVFDSTAPIDTILAQSPLPDTVVAPGALVMVTLSLGQPPIKPGSSIRNRINRTYQR